MIGRGYQGPLLTELIVRGGQALASEAPVEIEPDTFALGPRGPTLTLDGVTLADMVQQIDVGIGEGGWDVLAAGFWFSLPKAMALYSPSPEVEGDLPELHHPMNLEAFLNFTRVGRDAAELVIGAPGGGSLPMTLLETERGPVRSFAYEYLHEGAPWVQHKLALPYGPGRTILLGAQAPQALWADIHAAAVDVARSFAPIEA